MKISCEILLIIFVCCLIRSVSSVKCGFSEELASIGQTFDLADSKITIVGFEASVTYASLPAGYTPFLTVLAASEEPTFSSAEGTLTISAGGSCETLGGAFPLEDSFDEEPAAGDKSGPLEERKEYEDIQASGAFQLKPRSTMILSTFVSSCFVPRPFRGILLAASLLACISSVNGDEEVPAAGCKPSLELQISLPMGAEVASSFGETDHFLEATLDTVTWGYYDPNATAKVTMESGETVTVEVITHHSGHDYAKMIRGDPNVEEIFYWEMNQTLLDKPEPKLPGSGVHLITGPIEVVGAQVGDVVQVDILELDPRYNPVTGRCFGTNSQKFAGYQFRADGGTKRDGTPYVRTGGTEAITVFEFLEDEDGTMLYGKPVYMYRFPNMTAPDGSERTFDNNPAVMVPHEYDQGYDGDLLSEDPIEYPPGFDDTVVTDEGGILYLSPDPAGLNWKVPLRPHLGVLGVMPNNTINYIDEDAPGGANSIPPSRFGGNVDDWRIGKGGTMYYTVEVPGAMIVVGDTHAAQGDSELAGTAMETSMTAKLRVTLHKKDELPAMVQGLNFPLLETSTEFVIHGFAYNNYLDQVEDPSNVFAEGASLDLAMEDCFIKTRNWLMDTYGLIEEETIALMATAVDFGVTQVVDGNWGVHADIDKWVFDESDTPYDYSCTTSKSGRRGRGRKLMSGSSRRRVLEDHDILLSPDQYADSLYDRVTSQCTSCETHWNRRHLADALLNAKIKFVQRRM
ncbi:Acetamidase formamidase [Seminavis robusta]|uniref:Acetamidase formamidase n=1 Tax=Seminavis robusta TaxID=568900 RepID=A0A9N8DES9_9STRA|nr:Acetamidase formamidase [Seminavis robusta]|eukprot:Sro60_g034770.1 Acetamidase formamidase (741) ;mRNA; f:97445-100050